MHTLEEIHNFKGRYPKQLWSLFFTEMWERFSFYGMRGMLVYFMVNQMFFDTVAANLQYGSTQAWVYALTFLGGIIADKILGYRRSLFWGGLLMIVGSICLALDPKDLFFWGLAFNIIGTGFFKPNISTIVGKLYKEGDPRTDAGFTVFYASVNLGALLGGYLCIAIGKRALFANYVPEGFEWNVAFGLSAIVMAVSLLTFLHTQNSLAAIGQSPLQKISLKKRTVYETLAFLASLALVPFIVEMVSKTAYTDLFMGIVGPSALMYVAYEMRAFTWLENKRILASLLFMFLSIFFWAFFEQSGGSLSLFAAHHLDNQILGVTLDPNGVNNSANSLFVIIFAPLLGMLWIWMHHQKIEPGTVVKFALGFLFLGLGFYIFSATRFFADANGTTSLGVFVFGWFIITFGELCLSPIGLSAMTKLAPQNLRAALMGMWFLASAYGQYLAGILGANIAKSNIGSSNSEQLIIYTKGYQQLGYYALILGVLIMAFAPWIKKLMGGVK